MKQYKIRYGQNIYDIAVQLFGSIEGIYDILAENEWVTLDTEFKDGEIINYDEDFIINPNIKEFFETNKITVKNGNFFFEPFLNTSHLPCCMIIKQWGDTAIISGDITSTMIIDWGDTSHLCNVKGQFELAHNYIDNNNHCIKIYGQFDINTLNFSKLNGDIYPIEKIKTKAIYKPKNGQIFNNLFIKKQENE